MRREMEEHLRKVILPFWEGLADEKNGGYTGYVGFDLKKDENASAPTPTGHTGRSLK